MRCPAGECLPQSLPPVLIESARAPACSRQACSPQASQCRQHTRQEESQERKGLCPCTAAARHLQYLPTYQPTYLPTSLYLPTCLPTDLATCLPVCLPACLPACLPCTSSTALHSEGFLSEHHGHHLLVVLLVVVVLLLLFPPALKGSVVDAGCSPQLRRQHFFLIRVGAAAAFQSKKRKKPKQNIFIYLFTVVENRNSERARTSGACDGVQEAGKLPLAGGQFCASPLARTASREALLQKLVGQVDRLKLVDSRHATWLSRTAGYECVASLDDNLEANGQWRKHNCRCWS